MPTSEQSTPKRGRGRPQELNKAVKGTYYLDEQQIECLEKDAKKHGMSPSRLLRLLLNKIYGIEK